MSIKRVRKQKTMKIRNDCLRIMMMTTAEEKPDRVSSATRVEALRNGNPKCYLMLITRRNSWNVKSSLKHLLINVTDRRRLRSSRDTRRHLWWNDSSRLLWIMIPHLLIFILTSIIHNQSSGSSYESYFPKGHPSNSKWPYPKWHYERDALFFKRGDHRKLNLSFGSPDLPYHLYDLYALKIDSNDPKSGNLNTRMVIEFSSDHSGNKINGHDDHDGSPLYVGPNPTNINSVLPFGLQTNALNPFVLENAGWFSWRVIRELTTWFICDDRHEVVQMIRVCL